LRRRSCIHWAYGWGGFRLIDFNEKFENLTSKHLFGPFTCLNLLANTAAAADAEEEG